MAQAKQENLDHMIPFPLTSFVIVKTFCPEMISDAVSWLFLFGLCVSGIRI